MADIILSGLKKRKKIPLPPGWVENTSQKHPDTPFYFNSLTGETRWTPPDDSSDKKVENNKPQTIKPVDEDIKDFNSSTNAAKQTAAGSSHRTDGSSDRIILKAKSRRAFNEMGKKNIETAAMKQVREKMLQKKAPATKSSQSKKQIPTASRNSRPNPATSMHRKSRSHYATSPSSSQDSFSSVYSAISNTSSLGSKIKTAAAAAVAESMLASTSTSKSPTKNKLPRIQKISPSKRMAQSRANETTVDTSQEANNNFIDEKRRSLKRNAAEERLDSLRKRLSTGEKTPNKRVCSIEIKKENDNINLDEEISKFLNTPRPTLNRNAYKKLSSLERWVEKNCELDLKKNINLRREHEDIQFRRIEKKLGLDDSNCEEMEWESIDEQIMSEVNSVRVQLNERSWENANANLSEMTCSSIQPQNTSEEQVSLYVVVDTNVFLSNLPIIEEIRDSNSDKFGRPYIVVPWTVIQELDYIKDDKTSIQAYELKGKARKAVNFLNQHFSSKHPRILGQTPAEVEENKEKFIMECPDDEILQTCLQVRSPTRTCALLSYDKNLCNKAMIHGIKTLCREDTLEKISLKVNQATDFLTNSLHAHLEESHKEDASLIQKELLQAEDICEEGKALLKNVLSAAVAKEMEILFGKRWQNHVIIKPPWTLIDALKCALKHWMAAVSESFMRKSEYILKEILEIIKNPPDGGRKLKDVKFFLDKCESVIETMQNSKYPDLKPEMLKGINELRERCSKEIDEFKNIKFKNTVGYETDPQNEENRAELAFKVLEDVFAYSRDICGIAGTAIGIQISFEYAFPHPFISEKIAREHCKDVGMNINELIKALERCLDQQQSGLHPSDQAILDLYQVLSQFSSDLNFKELNNLTPLDVYCCVKRRKTKLLKGRDQLQTLNIHFCQIANFQCK